MTRIIRLLKSKQGLTTILFPFMFAITLPFFLFLWESMSLQAVKRKTDIVADNISMAIVNQVDIDALYEGELMLDREMVENAVEKAYGANYDQLGSNKYLLKPEINYNYSERDNLITAEVELRVKLKDNYVYFKKDKLNVVSKGVSRVYSNEDLLELKDSEYLSELTVEDLHNDLLIFENR